MVIKFILLLMCIYVHIYIYIYHYISFPGLSGVLHAPRPSSVRLMPPFSGLPEEKILDHSWLEGNRLVVIQEQKIHLISVEELLVVRTIETPD